MQIEKLLEENKEKDVVEILKILAWQQVITSQGAMYTGEKDWALNKILNWHKQSLKQLIDGLIERMEKQKYQQPLLGTPEPTERVMYVVNQTLDEEISHLKDLRSQIK